VGQRQGKSSLKPFFDLVVRDRHPGDPQLALNLKTLQEKYDSFCIYHELQEQSLQSRDGKAALKKNGFEVEAVSNPNTDVYTRIRWQTPGEMQTAKETGQPSQPKPFERSIDAFIRLRCVVSGIDADRIVGNVFHSKYNNFVVAQGIEAPTVITKGTMEAEFSTFHMRDEISVVVAADSGKYIDIAVDVRPEGNAPRTLKDDASLVFTQFAFFGLLPLPLLFVAMFSEGQARITSNDEWCGVEAVLTSFMWRGRECVEDLSPINYGFAVYVIAFWSLALAEAHTHYLTFEGVGHKSRDNQPVPEDGDFIRKLPRWFMQSLFDVAVCLTLGAYIAYGFLVGLWFVLGAILNPTQYLVFAAAALVLLAVIASKYSTVMKLVNGVSGIVKSKVRYLFLRTATRTASHMPCTVQGGSEELVRTMVIDSVREVAAEAGIATDFDPRLLYNVVAGQPGAIDSLAASLEVEPALLHAVYAVATQDAKKFLAWIERITSTTGFDPSHGFGNEILALVEGPDSNAGQSAVKRLWILFIQSLVSEDGSVIKANANQIASICRFQHAPAEYLKASGACCGGRRRRPRRRRLRCRRPTSPSLP